MTSFKFPPPPPPPPRAASDSQPSYPSQRGGQRGGQTGGQRGGQRGGRGDAGRGRGGGLSRGGNNFGGSPRGGSSQGHGGRGNQHNTGVPRSSQQNNKGGQNQRGGSTFGYGQQQQQYMPPAQAPTNAYANLPFQAPMQADGDAQSHMPPIALTKAMSFMSTPAGVQSMAALASHMASTGTQYPHSPAPQQPQQQPRYSPTQHSGQKRKRNDQGQAVHIQSQPQLQRKPHGPKPPRAKAAVAPAIPSFGFSLPEPAPAPPSKPPQVALSKNNTKGMVKLGLAHVASAEESSESEGDDADEEVVLGAALKGGGYAFEHEGEHISLQTAGDVKEWIRDRRRNFPTHEKAVEKAKAAVERRKHELEFVRKLKGKPPREEPPPQPRAAKPPKVHRPSARDERKQEELASLRKRLHESMHMKQGVNLGVEYGSETNSDADSSSVLSESSVVSSSEESSDSDDEFDEAPEPTSSKIGPPPINIPPPPPPPVHTHPRRPDSERPCPTHQRYGKCAYGDKCKFKHPNKKEEPKRATLYEKLVEQELLKSDNLALDAIKFLGQNGFLG